jgi:hypothetical protein
MNKATNMVRSERLRVEEILVSTSEKPKKVHSEMRRPRVDGLQP